ncbi:MAG TPA: ABC transporter substrate-binding protein [Solirubrobacteraceae bacterium]|nr:ABC transporter substrate-binding protein [Solirubrobacteraceae bacterium]
MLRPAATVARALLLAALVAYGAGCGGQDEKAGGHLTFLASGDVDYLDPGQTYSPFGYAVLYATNRTLYSFRPADALHPVPDLATGPPRISADKRTITVRIRPGVRYSPPLRHRTVSSADIKYAFERAFTKQVPSGYAGSYFGSIAGAPSPPNAHGYRPIRGIMTPDPHTLVLRLTRPDAVTVAQALVMPITVPVPRSYARPFDRRSPSTYDQHVVFTGPYMVKADASGRIVGRTPGRQIQLVRNPSWDPETDYRPAELDSITLQEGNNDLTVAGRRAISGKASVCCDVTQPPAPVVRRAMSAGQAQFVPSGGTLYAALNTTIPPFDNLNVRRAVLAAFDRRAALLTRGGRVAGDIASGFLPPGIPGFAEAGGLRQNQDLDFLRAVDGDAALARRYMLAARSQGVPVDDTGRYTGGRRLLAVGINAEPDRKTAEVVQAQLARLGLRLDLHPVPADTMFTKFCSVPGAKVAVCPSVGWYRDYTDAQPMLMPTFGGSSIRAEGNVNFPQLDVPAIDAAMAKAVTLPAGRQRNRAWARINHMVTEQAPAIPLVWSKSAVIASRDVDAVVNGYYGTPDLSFTALR